MNRPREPAPWPPLPPSLPEHPPDDPAAPATQIIDDSDAYLGQAPQEMGRRIAANQVELFVDGDVPQALAQELARHPGAFIALHGLGTRAVLHVLDSLAQASGGTLQRLLIRRQGAGSALASLPFVEVPQGDGSLVRVIASDSDSGPDLQEPVALVLLARSRLAVLMMGELPPQAVMPALHPLREALQNGPWPNRELLIVPLGGAAALAAAAGQLAAPGLVEVNVTPRAGSAQEVWAYISGAWNRQHGHASPGTATQHGSSLLPTDIAHAVPRPRVPQPEAPTALMPLPSFSPMPLSAAVPETRDSDQGFAPTLPLPLPQQGLPGQPAAHGGGRWQSYVDRCSGIKGLLRCCAFDTVSLQVLAQLGDRAGSERLARQGALMLSTLADNTRALGLGARVPDAAISTATHHLLLRTVPGHPGVALAAVLQAAHTNLTLARMQLERVEPPR